MSTANIPPWDTLPKKALEGVFSHLSGPQLEDLRLVCRRWNSVICSSPALMERFVVCFHSRPRSFFQTTNREEQTGIAAQLMAQFTVVGVDAGCIQHMPGSPLWAKLAQTVRTFSVMDSGLHCRLSVAKLLKVLRAMPNLTNFLFEVFDARCFFGDLLIDLKLDQLDTLCIGMNNARFIPLFSTMCHNLKDFESNDRSLIKKMDGDGILPIIKANNGTLNRIALKDFRPSVVDLSTVSCPNLKHLELENFVFTRRGLSDFILQSPNITYVSFMDFIFREASMVDVLQTLSHLKSLKHLAIRLKPFAEEMIDYGGLQLGTVRHLITTVFSLVACCPNVDCLGLVKQSLRDEDVIHVLQECPNLRKLAVAGGDADNKLSDVTLDYIATHGRRLEDLSLQLLKNTTKAARNRLRKACQATVKFW